MILEIETALAEYVEAAFAAADPPVTNASVQPAMSTEVKKAGAILVVVKCANAPHIVGGMVDAEIQIIVATPAGTPAGTAVAHTTIEKALRSAFPEDNSLVPEALAAAFATFMPSKTVCGFFFKGQQPGIEATQWVPYYELTLGLDPSA